MALRETDFYTAENVQSDLIETAHIVDENVIPIIASVIITEELWGRLDVIVNRYYGRLDPLQIILDFNNITDITTMQVGDVLNLPNINQLNLSTELRPMLDSMLVPGINTHGFDSMSEAEQLQMAREYKSKTTVPTTTTANPKLKVTVKKVHADIPNGIITF